MSEVITVVVDDEYWMHQALLLAAQASDIDEVPVGAVLVKNGNLIAGGFNQPISACDPSAHAEIQALRAGAKKMENYRLPGTTLYVTIEPCTMCVGAIIHARVSRLVFGAREPRAGAVISQANLLRAGHYNHRMEWQEGILADQCGGVMRKFFKRRRENKKAST